MKRNKTRNWLAVAALLPVLAGGLTAGCDDEDDSPADGGTGGRGGSTAGTGGGTGGTGGGTGGTGGGTGGTGGADAGDVAAPGDGASACGTTPTPVMADITVDTSWPCGVYVLKQKIYVTGNAKLTIAAGSTIQGDVTAADKSALIIARGSQLIAKGTKDKPIVFTSGNSVGSRKGGDWAGVALLGNAKINTGGPCTPAAAGCLESGIEGIPASEVRAKFGGVDDASSCGELEYVRIEFGGQQLEPNRELNGLTLGGCGSGTKLSYIQVHRGTDDGIEFFGGTASMDHILLTGNDDDGLDWDFGWTGKVQFLVVHQGQNAGDNGIEASNSPQMYAAAPRAKPTLYNVTLIGRGDGVGSSSSRPASAIHFKDGTQGVLKNFIIQGWKQDTIDLDTTRDPAVDPNTEWPANLSIENSIFWMNPMYGAEVAGMPSDDDKGFDDKAKVEEAARNNKTDVDPMLTSITTLLTTDKPNYVPKNAAVGNQATPAGVADTAANYAGAFAPNATTLWTDGWTDFPVN